jgi:hypothetical protein
MRVSPPLLQRFFLSLPFTLRLRFPPLGDPRLLNPQSQQPRQSLETCVPRWSLLTRDYKKNV